MEHLPIRAGNGSVKHLLDEVRVALISLGDVGGAIRVPFDEPLIPVLAAA